MRGERGGPTQGEPKGARSGGGRACAGMACLGVRGEGRPRGWGWWWKGPERSGGPSPAEPPAARGPNAVGPRASAAPGGSERPSVTGPSPLPERAAPASPAWGSPRTGPRAGAAAIRAPWLFLAGPPSPAKLPPKGECSLELVLGAGSPFFSPSRLFVRRGSPPALSGLVHSLPLLGRPPSSRRPSFLVILLLERARIFFSFLFSPFPPLWHSNYLLLPLFYKEMGALSALVLFLSCPRGYQLRAQTLSFENFLFR